MPLFSSLSPFLPVIILLVILEGLHTNLVNIILMIWWYEDDLILNAEEQIVLFSKYLAWAGMYCYCITCISLHYPPETENGLLAMWSVSYQWQVIRNELSVSRGNAASVPSINNHHRQSVMIITNNDEWYVWVRWSIRLFQAKYTDTFQQGIDYNIRSCYYRCI